MLRSDSYSPSSNVELYRYNSPSTDYIGWGMGVGSVVAPLFVIGTVALIVLYGFMCCGTCRKAKTPQRETVLLLVLAILYLTAMAVALTGYMREESVHNLSKDIPVLFNNILTLATTFAKTVNTTGVATRQSLNAVENLHVVDAGEVFLSLGVYNAMLVQLGIANAAISDIASQIQDVDFTQYNATMLNDYEFYETRRHNYSMYLFISMAFFALVTLGTTFYYLYLSKHPRSLGCGLICCFIGVGHIIWLLVAATMTGTVFMADVCSDPDETIVTLTQYNSSALTYYLFCDEDPSLTFPYKTDMQNMITGVQQFLSFFPASCTGAPDCTTPINAAIGALQANMSSLNVSITEVYTTMSCSAVNSLYQSTLNLVCRDAFEVVLTYYVYFLVYILCLMAAQLVNRFMPRRDLTKKQ